MLFPSTLVTSSDLSSIDPILAELGHISHINNPDIFLVSEYTIENVRSINNFLSRSPYNHNNKVVIIPEAHLLSVESQNTLLKNLEEPGINNYFILLTPRPNALIPTIVSRCHLIKIIQKTEKLDLFNFPNNTADALALSEKLAADKESVLPLLENQIKNTPPADYKTIQKLIKATLMLKANLDPKTVLDFLFLS